MGLEETVKKKDNVRPLLSASWNRSSTGTGTKTQFSGFGNTPTGELHREP